MTDLYLVAHKVRGEPAFDVAAQMDCPSCMDLAGYCPGCHECDEKGYWWIIPTSGHRAHPYWSSHFNQVVDFAMAAIAGNPLPPSMPNDWPDHYLHKAAPTISLIEALGLSKPAAKLPPMVRRL